MYECMSVNICNDCYVSKINRNKINIDISCLEVVKLKSTYYNR